jgi:hypothetical protein
MQQPNNRFDPSLRAQDSTALRRLACRLSSHGEFRTPAAETCRWAGFNRIDHIAYHNVIPEEFEEVCFSHSLVLRTKSHGENPSFGKMVQRSSLVNNVGKVDPERSRRTCGRGDAAAGERFGFCGALLLMQRPTTVLILRYRSGLDCAQETGVLPQLAVKVQDASG